MLRRKPSPASVKSILAVKLDEIGDMATATHVFRLLKEAYPHAELSVLCKPFNRSLLAHDPYIDHIITDIRETNRRYDIVAELRGNWQTFRKSIFTYRPKIRVDRGTVRLRNKGRQLHETLTNYEIIRPLLSQHTGNHKPAIYFGPEDESFVDGFLSAPGIGPFAILHTGARRSLRRWPGSRFALIATFLKEQHGLDTIFAGTAEDTQTIESIAQQVPFRTFSFTQGTLSQFACLCSKASVFIGNESGPLHIAASFGIPLIGLYGPGVPHVFYPVGEKSIVIHNVLDCNPCDQVHCVRPENPCINLIEVAEVKDSINALL